MASALALQYSPSWAMKTHTLEAGQFIAFINPWKEWNTERNDVNFGNTNEMSIWPSQWIALRWSYTAMVIYSFHLYSRSSHHFFQWLIFCFITWRTLLTVSAVEFTDSGNSTRTVTAVQLIFNLSRRERTPGNYRALTTLLFSYAY